MKLAYLTAGAAGMICGSCLHDNALAKSLIRLGHDCVLIPLYTPIRTDEEDISIDRVFMGGINVYLQQKMPWLGYLPRWVDGFLNQPWIIGPLTKNAGKTSPALLGALTVSMLQGIHGRQKKEFKGLLDWLSSEVRPDILVFTNLLVAGGIPEVKRRGGTRVYVTLQGDDIFLDSLPEKYRIKAIDRMQQLVQYVDGFIIHSQDYAKRMAKLLQIPNEKLHVIPLGIDVSDFRDQAIHPDPTDFFSIGYLARMAPEKGLHQLIDAFISIAQRPEAKQVKLKLAGWMGPQHAEFWEAQKSKLKQAGLDDRWEYLGSIDRAAKTDFLRSIDLFCVPTTYEEPKGLFLLEAIAAGAPYLQPNHGAFPELHDRMKRSNEEHHFGELFQAGSIEDLGNRMIGAVQRKQIRSTASAKTLEEIDIATHAKRLLDCFAKPI